MFDFFHGWRRKAGCLTLVMALSLFGLWMRSRTIGDKVVLVISDTWVEWIASGDEHLLWGRHRFESPEGHSPSDLYSQFIPDKWLDPPSNLDWQWRYGRFGVAENRHDEMKCIVVPHWSLVLPMTLLSAYLIASKPRQSSKPDAGNVPNA